MGSYGRLDSATSEAVLATWLGITSESVSSHLINLQMTWTTSSLIIPRLEKTALNPQYPNPTCINSLEIADCCQPIFPANSLKNVLKRVFLLRSMLYAFLAKLCACRLLMLM